MTRTPKLLFIAGLLIGAIFAAGCASNDNQPPPPTPVVPPSPLYLNESMNGSTFAVPVNTTITLELAENPSTGYSWNLTATSGLHLIRNEYVPGVANATVVGAGGIHRWELLTNATGLQEIEGVYRRPWENATAPAATFYVELSVTP